MSAETNQLVQICLPTHNGEAHLAQALDSLLAQTHRQIKIHVVDNASTDRTPLIAQAYAAKDSRVAFKHFNEFVSADESWNRAFGCIDRSASSYFMWASDDDLWSPDYIERLIVPLVNNHAFVLSFSQFSRIDDSGNEFGEVGYRSLYPRGREFLRIRNLIATGRYSAIYGLIRLSAVTWPAPMVGMSFGSDLWFMIQLAAVGPFHHTAQPLFHKRIGGISATNGDVSASRDPDKTWILDHDEWRAIASLNLNIVTKLYIFNRLRISSKLLFPSKEIPRPLMPLVYFMALRRNIRAFGIRSRILRLFRQLA